MKINTMIVMTVCAFTLGITGIAFSFFPQELANYLGWANTPPIVLQIIGALYFGFAMVNWTARASLIGGVYGRPIAMGNFTHFLVGGLALIKLTMYHPDASNILAITLVYSIFSILFGYIFFASPKRKTDEITFTHV